MDSSQATSEAQPTWRLRAELHDRPGALAKLTASLAALDCNILALTVLPVPGGVVDDLVISTPEEVRPAELVTLVRTVGGRCAGITKAHLSDLADAPTAALRVAAQLVAGVVGQAEAVRELLDADAVEAGSVEVSGIGPGTSKPPGEQAGSVGTQGIQPGGRQVVLSDGLVVRRGWAAFTEVELARSAALEELIGAVRGAGLEPRAVLTADGAGVVLRAGLPADADAIAAMHDRCSAVDRFPVGSRSIGPQPMPRRLLNRPLVEPRGRTVVGAVGHQVVALGQLIRTTDPAIAEVSLLVEDDWQGRGLGTELLAELARVARAAGHRELVAWCPPEDTAMLRSASAARLPARTTREGGLLRVTMATTPEVRQTTAT